MPIHTHKNGWILETQNTAYAFGIAQDAWLAHRYWGAKLPYPDDYPGDLIGDKTAIGPYRIEGEFPFNGMGNLIPQEYPTGAGTQYIEPCLKVVFADGVRDVRLQFERAEVDTHAAPELKVHLCDAAYPLNLTLHYRVWEAFDLIERFVTIENEGDAPVSLERVWSAQWHLPIGGRYRLSHLGGRWANESTA